ncbi:hypothetical protein [Flavisolibacter tropicus]|nr:hypothetical protein [Flavisolibacter tropicus]
MKSLNSIMSKFFLSLFLMVTVPASINTLQAAILHEKQPPLSIRYVGKVEDMLLFDVNFDNDNAGRFRIIDEFGNTLFDEKVQSLVGVKRFKIKTEGARKIHFETTTKEGIQRKTFVIAFHVEEKLTVTEVE